VAVVAGVAPGSRSSDHLLAARSPTRYGAVPMKILATVLVALLIPALVTNAKAADRLQHVVCFRFKSTATTQDITNVEQAFRALKQKIPQVATLEWGTNVSQEKKDKGFTHCFILSFKSEKDRDAYIVHPEHKAFGKQLGPLLDDVFVIDFWSKK
jgi:hypothetical protein